MTFSPNFAMPGAFHAEGVHPGLFRPPVSSASSSGYLAGPAGRLQTTTLDATPKRKRGRGDFFARPQETELADSAVASDPFLDSPAAAIQPEPRAYTLAGQLDTPNGGGPVDSGILGESAYSDSDYRRVLGSKRTRDDIDNGSNGPTPLFNLPSQTSPSRGWGTAAFSTLGGVVGKVWEFCTTSAFKGFYAGGGAGFEITADGTIAEDASMFGRAPPDEYECYGQRIPGFFPQGDHGYYYHEDAPEPLPIDSGASTPSGPSAKRRQTEQLDTLGRNWVIVTEPRAGTDKRVPRRPPSSHRLSPRNRNHAPAVTTGRRISAPAARPPSTTPGAAPRRTTNRFAPTFTASPAPINPPRPGSSASFASPRSPSPTKIPTRTSLGGGTQSASSTPARGHVRRRSSIAHSSNAPPMTHRRTNSAASTASSRGNAEEAEASPRLDAEARQLAARRKMEERDADYRIAAFNKRLQDMIRQGKEALGTTIEVDGDGGDVDVGWVDE